MDARANAHQKPTANHYDNILIHTFINYHTIYFTCVYFFQFTGLVSYWFQIWGKKMYGIFGRKIIKLFGSQNSMRMAKRIGCFLCGKTIFIGDT